MLRRLTAWVAVVGMVGLMAGSTGGNRRARGRGRARRDSEGQARGRGSGEPPGQSVTGSAAPGVFSGAVCVRMSSLGLRLARVTL